MAIILDADVIIGGEKKTFDLETWLDQNSNEEFAIASITVAELWHGVERAKTAKQRSTRQKYLQSIQSILPVIPYTMASAFEHARLWAHLEETGEMIGYYDLIVSAIALERGDGVATFNTRHFERVPKLKVILPVCK